MRIAITQPMTRMMAVAGTRFSFRLSCRVATGASYRLMMELRPANRTQTKKMTPMIRPPGIPLRTLTSQTNMRPGPPLSSGAPPAAMAGMITNAASRAASVSKIATFLAEPGRFSFLGR